MKKLKRISAAVTALIMTAGMTLQAFAEGSELPPPSSADGIRGDINGDDIVDVLDVMRYKRRILNGDVITTFGGYDINRNGTLDGRDVLAVKNAVLGASKLWSYSQVPDMENNTLSSDLESVLKSEMLGLKNSEAKKLYSDDDVTGPFEKLISGDTDLVFTDSVPEEQRKAAAEAGVKLNIVPVAKSGLVFIVNKNNPVGSLTSDQIKGIYSGKITNWKEVGGNDELIVAFQRNDNTDSQRYMKKWMSGTELSEPLKIDDAVSEYKNLENAIGFTCYSNAAQMCEVSPEIKYIAVDGVKPSAETMNDGTYPVLSSIAAVYTAGASQNTRDFAAWLLSAEGQNAVAKSGCIPVNNTGSQVKNKLYTAKGTGKEKPADLRPDWHGSHISLHEKDGSTQKLSWTNGMPKSECGLSCLKDKDVEEKINADIRNVMFGGRDNLPGSWKMNVDVYNGYMNVTFKKSGGAAEDVRLNYDLRTGNKLEKFSDLFYKDTDFLPLLNRLLARKTAQDDKGTYITDYLGLSDDITQFDFESIVLGDNNPYTAETVSLPLQDGMTREMMGNLVLSEHCNSRELFEEGTLFKSYTAFTEWSTNEWIKDFSYGSDGKLHYDFMSYYHTPEEIEERNRACDTVYEKACDLFAKEFPEAAGKLRTDKEVFMDDLEMEIIMVQTGAFCAKVDAGEDYPYRYYYFDPETREQIHISDILGKNFEKYNEQYYIAGININAGIAYLYRFTRDEGNSPDTLEIKISLEELNMKYVKVPETYVKAFTRIRNGSVNSENALVYPESYVIKHNKEKGGEPVQKGRKVEIRNFAEFLGKTLYECWNAESGDYCGWIDKDHITVQYTEEENKIKFRSFEDQEIEFHLAKIVPDAEIISYSNESVMDPDSELQNSGVDLAGEDYVRARNKCISHGKMLYECWCGDRCLGWIDIHDLRIHPYTIKKKNYPEKLEKEIRGTVPGSEFNGIDFYSSDYIAEDEPTAESVVCIGNDVKIKADRRCDFRGTWWYECTSAEEGTYLGWVDGDLIEFE